MLLEVCDELTNRVGLAKERLSSDATKPASLTAPEFDKLRKALLKTFPLKSTAVTTSTPGYEQFGQQAHKALEDLEPTFAVFADVSAFCERAFRTISTFARRQARLQFEDSPRVVSSLMNLLSGYVSLHLLLARVPQRNEVVAVYAHAFAYSNGGAEASEADQVAKFLSTLDADGGNPLRELQERCALLGDMLTAVVTSLYMPYINGVNQDNLRSNSTLNPLYTPEQLAMPAHKPIYHDLIHMEAFERWIVLACLACPALLAAESLRGLFLLAGGNSYVLSIGRGEVLDFHSAVDTLLKWFPTSKSGSALAGVKFEPSGFKPKKAFEALARQAVANGGAEHRQRRCFLAGEIANNLRLCRGCPGLIGPKLPLVLALLALGRAELRWFLVHHQQPAPPKVKAKLVASVAATYAPHFVSQLMHGMAELSRLVLANRTLVQRYYIEYLRGAHHTDLCVQLTTVDECTDVSETDDLRALMGGIVHALSPANARNLDPDAPETAGEDGSIAAMRLNWVRLEALLTAPSMAAAKHVPGIKDFNKRMKVVLWHSRFVDDLGGVLAEHAEMPEACFGELRARMRGLFSHALAGDEPGMALAYVRQVGHTYVLYFLVVLLLDSRLTPCSFCFALLSPLLYLLACGSCTPHCSPPRRASSRSWARR